MPGILEIRSPFHVLVEGLSAVADRFLRGPEEKAAYTLEVTRLTQAAEQQIEESLRKELESKERVLIAELTQDDLFTKRARPTVVYTGLLALLVNHIVLPWSAYFLGTSASALPRIDLPDAFWLGWSGIVTTWVIGRTVEKRASITNGAKPPGVVSLITGTR